MAPRGARRRRGRAKSFAALRFARTEALEPMAWHFDYQRRSSRCSSSALRWAGHAEETSLSLVLGLPASDGPAHRSAPLEHTGLPASPIHPPTLSATRIHLAWCEPVVAHPPNPTHAAAFRLLLSWTRNAPPHSKVSVPGSGWQDRPRQEAEGELHGCTCRVSCQPDPGTETGDALETAIQTRAPETGDTVSPSRARCRVRSTHRSLPLRGPSRPVLRGCAGRSPALGPGCAALRRAA